MFRAKIIKNEYPCKPQFYFIKVGCEGVKITQVCYHNAKNVLITRENFAAMKKIQVKRSNQRVIWPKDANRMENSKKP